MPTTPGGRFSPGDTDDWDLTTDLAAMQVSNESATATEISAAIAAMPAQPQNYRIGTDAQRLALSGANLFTGLRFQTTTNGSFEWLNTTGTAAGWRIAPGQLLASFVGPVANTSGPGAIVGSVTSTIPLPIGQKFSIHAFYSGFASSAGGIGEVTLNWRNASADVTFTTRDGFQLGRSYSVQASFVGASNSFALVGTTTVAAKVSAAMYTVNALSGVYGADNTQMFIRSA